MRVRLAIAFFAFAATALPATAGAADVPPGAVWSQATIPSTGGVKLHADVLRPRSATGKTPVILSIGPYFNHSGQTGPASDFSVP
jgi:predicted acyl esterase